MNTSESITAIAPALLAAQKAIDAVVNDGVNPFYNNSTYARLAAVIGGVKPALNDNGIMFLQAIGHDGNGATITTRLLHESGEWIEDTAPVVCKKFYDPQALGSGLTYMKRYALVALVGLPTVDEIDDDGAAAGESDDAPPKPLLKAETVRTEACVKYLKQFKNADDALAALRAGKTLGDGAEAAVRGFYQ